MSRTRRKAPEWVFDCWLYEESNRLHGTYVDDGFYASGVGKPSYDGEVRDWQEIDGPKSKRFFKKYANKKRRQYNRRVAQLEES